jgi:hypothetical protein
MQGFNLTNRGSLIINDALLYLKQLNQKQKELLKKYFKVEKNIIILLRKFYLTNCNLILIKKYFNLKKVNNLMQKQF